MDRARRIANNLLALLPDAEIAKHVATARRLGETWLGADLLRYDATDVITTREAAELVHVGPSTVRKWHSEGYLANHLGRTGRYVVAAVLDCAAARRRVSSSAEAVSPGAAATPGEP